jgi:hypothetical protein
MKIRFAFRFAVACLVFLAACGGWQPLPQDPAPAAVPTTRLRVTRTNGEVLELSGGAVRGDSLLGFRTYYIEDPRVAIPLAEVARIEAAQTNYVVPVLAGLGMSALFMRWIVVPWLYTGW